MHYTPLKSLRQRERQLWFPEIAVHMNYNDSYGWCVMELSDFGERLAKLRTIKGVSAREMSLSLGQSANYINKIENGKSYPSMASFFYICDYLNISKKDFFDEEINDPTIVSEMVSEYKRLNHGAQSQFNELLKELNRNRR